MKECWINVYWYPILNNAYYSHAFKSKSDAMAASINKMYGASKWYKTVYRIHVRMK